MFPQDIAEREAYILECVRQGNFEATWTFIRSEYKGHSAQVCVMSDALKIGGVRVNVSATLQQQIADTLGCMLLTPKVADLLWSQRTVDVTPCPRYITSSTKAMIEHSDQIDAILDIASSTLEPRLVSTVGKHWCIDPDLRNHPGKALNYGWHFSGVNFQGILGEITASSMKSSTGSYVRLIQGRGWCHDAKHVDYSQTCVLMRDWVWVDNNLMPVAEVLMQPELAPLLNHNGCSTILRQPGVDLVSKAFTLEVMIPS